MIRILLTILFLTNYGILLADECEQKLDKAKRDYDFGRPELVRAQLEDCLSKLQGEKRIEAFKLMILAELAADNYKAAEALFKSMLKANPEFQPEPDDPQEFRDLFGSFRTAPILSIGVRLGGNQSRPTAYNTYGIAPDGAYKSNYQNGISYEVGLGADIYISKHFQATAHLLLREDAFTYKGEFLDFAALTVDHSMQRIVVPIGLKYIVGTNRYGLTVEAGLATSFPLNFNANIVRQNFTLLDEKEVSGPSLEVSNMLHENFFQAYFGVSKRIKIPTGYLSLNLQYFYGLNNVLQENQRYSNPELVYRYGYIMDDFTLHNISASIGYYYSFYKAKKLK